MRQTPAHSKRPAPIIDALLLLAYLLFIYCLSAQPHLPAPMFFTWQDKLYHAGAYFVMGLLAWRCCRHINVDLRTQLLASVIFCVLYGLSDEWHQYYVPGRSASAADWLADTLGAALAAIALRLFLPIPSKR